MDYNGHFNKVDYHPVRLRRLLLGLELTTTPLSRFFTSRYSIVDIEYLGGKTVSDLKEEDKQYLLGLYRATNHLPISI